MEPIARIAAELGLKEEHLIPYGHHKAKISLDALGGGNRVNKASWWW